MYSRPCPSPMRLWRSWKKLKSLECWLLAALRMARPIGSFPGRLRARLERPGLGARGERRFRFVSTLVVALFAAGWIGAIVETARAGTPADGAPPPALGAAITANPRSAGAAPPAAFLIDQAL